MTRAAWVVFLVGTVACGGEPPAVASARHPVAIRIQDASPWHVHAPGRPFSVLVRTSDPGIPVTIQARWVDAEGKLLGPAVPLRPGKAATLRSPGGDVGYYGLHFASADRRVAFPPQPAGFPSTEYGFAILPPADTRRPPDVESPFGMIHCGIRVDGRWDPYLRGHHCKTLTWRTRGAKYWGKVIQERLDAGLTELPMVYKEPWSSDNDVPIGAEHLRRLADRFRKYARAEPNAPWWELGREENRKKRYRTPHYLGNLEAKARAIRGVLSEMGSKSLLVYNFEGFNYKDLERLVKSGALHQFDVFSLHPYRWKRFESPETWLPGHVQKARELLRRHALGDMEIWFTEIGIPVRGIRDPKGFYGYPSSRKTLPGASREYAARYVVRYHAVAFAEGVRRIYHYNYQNRGDDITYAEDNFGLRSYTGSSRQAGFPLPGYVAYVTMLSQLSGKRFVRAHPPRDGVRIYEFARDGDPETTAVAWVHPDAEVDLPWTALRAGLTARAVTSIVDLYGTPRAVRDAGVTLGGRPCWITFRAP